MVGIRNISDYSPFGVLLAERTVESEFFRRSFNGMENDPELKGNGNSYDFGARMLDPRVGRFLSLDAYSIYAPGNSNYSLSGNSPIRNIDNGGDSVLFYSESGMYLGYSNDNQRYKDKNLLVIVDDKAVENFSNQYNRKRSQAYKSENSLSNDQVEQHVSGLEAMGQSFELNSFEIFYSKYKDKVMVNGEAVSRRMIDSGIPGMGKIIEPYVEWTIGLKNEPINANDKNGSIMIDFSSKPYSDNKPASVATSANAEGIGGFHTHTPDGNPLPSGNPDHSNADTKARGVWQIVQGDGFFTLYRDNTPYDVSQKNIQEITIRTSGTLTKGQKGM